MWPEKKFSWFLFLVFPFSFVRASDVDGERPKTNPVCLVSLLIARLLPENVSVELTESKVLVRAKRPESENMSAAASGESVRYTHLERCRMRDLERDVLLHRRLPANASVEARMENGLLQIRIQHDDAPRAEPSARKVSIK